MRRAILCLLLGIRGFKQARPACLRAMIALTLLFPSIAACLNDAGPTSSPPMITGYMPLALTSGCTQADVLEDSTPTDVGPEPPSRGYFSSECSGSPGRVSTYSSRHSNQFIEWTPDGKRLVLNAPKEGQILGTGIYLVSADDSGSRLLVDANPGQHMSAGFHADLSPDGSTLVYSTCKPIPPLYRFRDYEIASLNVDEGAPEIVISSDNDSDIDIVNYPVWSPDGSRIAFFTSRPGHSYRYPSARLYTMEADGGVPRILTPHLNWLYEAAPVLPTWSPDGERIAYVQMGGPFGRPLLFKVEENGFGLRGVTTVTTGASWAPEGRRIAFGKALARRYPSDDPYSTLCMAELDELGRPRLSQITPTDAFQGPVTISHVNWSPDGHEILFIVSERHRDYSVNSVYLVRPDGTGLRRLLEDERPYTVAAWSPDGSQIAIRVDPQLRDVSRELRSDTPLEQTNPLFEVLIVDRDGAIQTKLGREEILETR